MKFTGSTAFYGVAGSASFYQGGALSTLVPDVFTVSIGGRPYMIDLDQPFYRQYRRQIAPLIRTQADTSKLPGEQTLDPNGLWRRSFEDWSLGAGQRYLDRETSVNNGFWQSKGVDCLSAKWQIGLLPDTSNQKSSANTNLQVVAANGYVYVADGNTLSYTSSLAGTVSWTAVTGTPASPVLSIATDGYDVYAAYATGIWYTAAGAASATQIVTSSLAAGCQIGYVNGRLMVANGQSLYNVVSYSSSALPTALLTTNNPNTKWTGFASGNNFLYVAGNVGGVGYVWGVTVTADGASLSAPVVELTLPAGEQVTAIFGYLGQLVIGTTLGVRYAQTSSSGIEMGSLITGQLPNSYGPTSPVQCAAGYGRWVWFGWTNYDSGSTGLGRLDLENFVITGALPAFASDRMATAQGPVTGVAVLNGTVIFAVSGQGFYVDSTSLVASGKVNSGYILYDLTDPKITSLLDIQTVGALTYGSYSAAIATDGGAFTSVLTHTPGEPEPVSVSLPGNSGQRFELQLTLNRDGTTPSQGPLITRWTLRVYPAPRRPVTWQLPLIFNERIVENSMGSQGFDPFVELQALELMAAQGLPVTYQEANQSFQVFVQDVQFIPDELTSDKHYYNGLCLVNLEGLPVPN